MVATATTQEHENDGEPAPMHRGQTSGIRQSPKSPGDASETGRIPATQTSQDAYFRNRPRRDVAFSRALITLRTPNVKHKALRISN